MPSLLRSPQPLTPGARPPITLGRLAVKPEDRASLLPSVHQGRGSAPWGHCLAQKMPELVPDDLYAPTKREKCLLSCPATYGAAEDSVDGGWSPPPHLLRLWQGSAEGSLRSGTGAESHGAEMTLPAGAAVCREGGHVPWPLVLHACVLRESFPGVLAMTWRLGCGAFLAGGWGSGRVREAGREDSLEHCPSPW